MGVIGVGNTLNNISNSPTGRTDARAEAAEKNSKEDRKTSNNINASELNLPNQKANTLKELFARKQALKLQLDQFEKDLKVGGILDEHAANSETLKDTALLNHDEVNRLNALKEGLKETYGVEDGSAEQTDLKLLEKKAAGSELTAEEEDRLANMGPLTDYQKAALEYTKMADEFMKRADAASGASINEKSTIIAIKLGLLKSNPMLKAKEEAEDMMKQVDEEIQKAITDELKDKVDENLDIDPKDQLLNDPQSLIDNKKLTEEDLKGLAVDEKI